MKNGIKEAKKCCYSHFTSYFRNTRKENKQGNIKKKKLFKTIRQEKQKNKLFMNYYVCIQKKKKSKDDWIII